MSDTVGWVRRKAITNQWAGSGGLRGDAADPSYAPHDLSCIYVRLSNSAPVGKNCEVSKLSFSSVVYHVTNGNDVDFPGSVIQLDKNGAWC